MFRAGIETELDSLVGCKGFESYIQARSALYNSIEESSIQSRIMQPEAIRVIVKLRSQHSSNVLEPYRTQLRVFTGASKSEESEDSAARIKVVEDGKKILYKVLNPVAESNVSAADTHIFNCAGCSPESTTQVEFFNNCGVNRVLDQALVIHSDRKDEKHMHIHNCCVMACGQTGAGKTYTMFGPGPPRGSQSVLDIPTHEHDSFESEPHSGPDDGLIVRSVEYLFAKMAEHDRNGAQPAQFVLKLSCVEVCDEEAHDLFSGSTLPVTIKEHPVDGFTVQGCQLIDCTNFEVAAAAIELIARHRRGRYPSSPHSKRNLGDVHNGVHKVDRSHCIMEICICSPPSGEEAAQIEDVDSASAQQNGDKLHIQTDTVTDLTTATTEQQSASRYSILAKITFVDLAGSERMKVTKAAENTLDGKGKKTSKPTSTPTSELGYINPSIYTLGRVIAGLVRAHGSIHNANVPFQDSVLTKLLIHALSVGSRHHCNIMVACVENSRACEQETLRTLKFATSCANIHTPAARLSKQDKLILDLKSNIKRVRQENTEMRRTILTTPSYGDKVLAHLDDESLELSEVFAHADPKIKPQIKDVRKPVAASTGSEKKRTWTSWKLFETKKSKGKGTVEIKIPGLGGSKSSQVHPIAFLDHFPSQHVAPAAQHLREKPQHSGAADKDKGQKTNFSGTASGTLMFSQTTGPDHQSIAEDEVEEDNGFEDAAWQERQLMERDSEPSAARSGERNGERDGAQRPATSPQLRTAPTITTLTREDSLATNSHASFTSTRSKDPSQQLVMDDLIRRRASGPMVFRGKTAEVIIPVRETARLNQVASTALEMKLAEQRKALQMKKLVQDECRKKNSQGVSPYLAHFVPKKVIKDRPDFQITRPESPPIVTHSQDFYWLPHTHGGSGDKSLHRASGDGSHERLNAHETSIAHSAQQIGEANMSLSQHDAVSRNVRHGTTTPSRERSRSPSRTPKSRSPSKSRPVSRNKTRGTKTQRPRSSHGGLGCPGEGGSQRKHRSKEVEVLMAQAHTKLADLLVAEYSAGHSGTTSPGNSSRALLEINPTPLVDRIRDVQPPSKKQEPAPVESFSPHEEPMLSLAVEGKSLSPQQTKQLREEPKPAGEGDDEGEVDYGDETYEDDAGFEADDTDATAEATAEATAAADMNTGIQVEDSLTEDTTAEPSAPVAAEEPAQEDAAAGQSAAPDAEAGTAERDAAEVMRLQQERQEQLDREAAAAAEAEALARQSEEELLVAQLYEAAEQRRLDEQTSVFPVRSGSIDEPAAAPAASQQQDDGAEDYEEEFEADADDAQAEAEAEPALSGSTKPTVALMPQVDNDAEQAAAIEPATEPEPFAVEKSEQDAETEASQPPATSPPAPAPAPEESYEEDAYEEEFEADAEAEDGSAPGAGAEAGAVLAVAAVAAVGVTADVASAAGAAGGDAGQGAPVVSTPAAASSVAAATLEQAASSAAESATRSTELKESAEETAPAERNETAEVIGADLEPPAEVSSEPAVIAEPEAELEAISVVSTAVPSETEVEAPVESALEALVETAQKIEPASYTPAAETPPETVPEAAPSSSATEDHAYEEEAYEEEFEPDEEAAESAQPGPTPASPVIAATTPESNVLPEQEEGPTADSIDLPVPEVTSSVVADVAFDEVNAEAVEPVTAVLSTPEEPTHEADDAQLPISQLFAKTDALDTELAANDNLADVASASAHAVDEAEVSTAPQAQDQDENAYEDEFEQFESEKSPVYSPATPSTELLQATLAVTKEGDAEGDAPALQSEQQGENVEDLPEWSAVNALVSDAVHSAVDRLTPLAPEFTEAAEQPTGPPEQWAEVTHLVADAVDSAVSRLTSLPAEFEADSDAIADLSLLPALAELPDMQTQEVAAEVAPTAERDDSTSAEEAAQSQQLEVTADVQDSPDAEFDYEFAEPEAASSVTEDMTVGADTTLNNEPSAVESAILQDPQMSSKVREEDVVIVQTQLRSFIAKAKVRKIRESKEGAASGTAEDENVDGDEAEEPAIDGETAPVDSAAAPAVDETPSPASSEQPTEGTSDEAPAAPATQAPHTPANTVREEDVVIVQTQLRSFIAKAKVRKIREGKEGAVGSADEEDAAADEIEAEGEAGAEGEEPTIESEAAPVEPVEAPSTVSPPASAEPAVRTQPVMETASTKAVREEDVVIVQTQLRSFIAKAKVRKIREGKEGAAPGDGSAEEEDADADEVEAEGEAGDGAEEPAIEGEAALMEPAVASAVDETQAANAEQPAEGTSDEAPAMQAPQAPACTVREEDVVIVQTQLRSFIAKAKVRKIREGKEVAASGDGSAEEEDADAEEAEGEAGPEEPTIDCDSALMEPAAASPAIAETPAASAEQPTEGTSDKAPTTQAPQAPHTPASTVREEDVVIVQTQLRSFIAKAKVRKIREGKEGAASGTAEEDDAGADEAEGEAGAEEPAIEGETAPVEPAAAPAVDGAPSPASAEQPTEGTSDEAPAAPATQAPHTPASTVREEDVVIVQTQLRSFIAKAKVRKIREGKEVAASGDGSAEEEDADGEETEAEAGAEEPAIEGEAAPAEPAAVAPAVDETPAASTQQPAEGTSDEAPTAQTSPPASTVCEEDVVIVQTQLRSFIAKAKVRKIREGKEGAASGTGEDENVDGDEAEADAVVEEPASEGEAAPVEPAPAPADDEIPTASAEQSTEGTSDEIPAASASSASAEQPETAQPAMETASAKTVREEDVVIVQTQLRSFIAKAKVRKIRESKEGAAPGEGSAEEDDADVAPAVEETPAASAEQPTEGTSDEAPTAQTPQAPASTVREEDVVIVQTQLRSFIAKAKVRKIRESKEGAAPGDGSAEEEDADGEEGQGEAGAEGEEPTIKSEAAPVEPAAVAPAVEEPPPASAAQPEPALPVMETASTKAVREEDVVIVQTQLRSFIAKAKVRKIREGKEGAAPGDGSAEDDDADGEEGQEEAGDGAVVEALDSETPVAAAEPALVKAAEVSLVESLPSEPHGAVSPDDAQPQPERDPQPVLPPIQVEEPSSALQEQASEPIVDTDEADGAGTAIIEPGFSVKTKKSEAASEFDYDVDFSEVGGSLKEMLSATDLQADSALALAALAFAGSEGENTPAEEAAPEPVAESAEGQSAAVDVAVASELSGATEPAVPAAGIQEEHQGTATDALTTHTEASVEPAALKPDDSAPPENEDDLFDVDF